MHNPPELHGTPTERINLGRIAAVLLGGEDGTAIPWYRLIPILERQLELAKLYAADHEND